MIAPHAFRHPEFRERVADAIVEMLAHLPETDRDIFIWSHYRGYQAEEIAEILRWSRPEVEAVLHAVNSILSEITRTLLAENPELESETNLLSDGALATRSR